MIHIHNYESGSNHQSHLQSLYLLYYLTQLMYVACTCTDLLIEKNRKKQYFQKGKSAKLKVKEMLKRRLIGNLRELEKNESSSS